MPSALVTANSIIYLQQPPALPPAVQARRVPTLRRPPGAANPDTMIGAGRGGLKPRPDGSPADPRSTACHRWTRPDGWYVPPATEESRESEQEVDLFGIPE